MTLVWKHLARCLHRLKFVPERPILEIRHQVPQGFGIDVIVKHFDDMGVFELCGLFGFPAETSAFIFGPIPKHLFDGIFLTSCVIAVQVHDAKATLADVLYKIQRHFFVPPKFKQGIEKTGQNKTPLLVVQNSLEIYRKLLTEKRKFCAVNYIVCSSYKELLYLHLHLLLI